MGRGFEPSSGTPESVTDQRLPGWARLWSALGPCKGGQGVVVGRLQERSWTAEARGAKPGGKQLRSEIETPMLRLRMLPTSCRCLLRRRASLWISSSPVARTAYQAGRFTGTVNALFRIGDKPSPGFHCNPGMSQRRGGVQIRGPGARELWGRTRFPTPSRSRSDEPERATAFHVGADLATRNGGNRRRPGESVVVRARLASSSGAYGHSTPRRTFDGRGRGGERDTTMPGWRLLRAQWTAPGRFAAPTHIGQFMRELPRRATTLRPTAT